MGMFFECKIFKKVLIQSSNPLTLNIMKHALHGSKLSKLYFIFSIGLDKLNFTAAELNETALRL